MKVKWFTLFLLCVTMAGSAGPSLLGADDQPKLILTLVIDQGRADYMDRFGDNFQGGLKWLLENGKVFSEAYHAHAITATGTGHGVLGTGYYPRKNGIIGNSWYRNEGAEAINCVADSSVRATTTAGDFLGTPRSSANLAVTGLSDWMEAAEPGFKDLWDQPQGPRCDSSRRKESGRSFLVRLR